MCWTSDKIPTRNIATKDIVCFKVFQEEDVVFETRKFLGISFRKKIKYLVSLWRKHTYIPYKENPKIDLVCVENYDILGYVTWDIYEGYHSYTTLCTTEKHNKSHYYAVKCIIPKGSVYYINNDCIVSSNIIVTDKVIN